MHDTLDERLTLLNGDLEAAAGVRSPMAARVRGEERRRAHRRRVAVGATMAVVGILGVGSLVAFRPASGGQSSTTHQPTSTSPATSAAPPTVGGTPSAEAKPTVTIDVTRDSMTVYDQNSKVLRTIPVTAGTAQHPTRTGVFTVTEKEDAVTVDSDTVGFSTDAYNLLVHSAVEVDGGGPFLYAMPWRPSEEFGKSNTTHGDVGMSDADAKWLYNHVKVGDRIEVK